MQAMKGIQPFEQVMILIVLVTALIALAYAYWLARQIFAADKGSEVMQRLWGFIRSGANAYLRTQLRTIAILIVLLTIAMFFSVVLVRPTGEANELFCEETVYQAYADTIAANTSLSSTEALAAMNEPGVTPKQVATANGFEDFNPDRVSADPTLVECPAAVTGVAIGRALAFAMGATFSATVGFIGMNMAVQGNVRVAAASRTSFAQALTIAYRSGTITGMLTDSLGLLGGTLIFIIFGKAAPDVLLGFGFGGTLLALFMRVGGGIYTKAADVGADLVGKVEAGMEEDDPRNAAVIADLVGDNVGDCAGMAADIFKSYEVTIVASLILGLALTALTGHLFWIVLPLLVRGIGVVSTIIGTYAVALWKSDDAEIGHVPQLRAFQHDHHHRRLPPGRLLCRGTKHRRQSIGLPVDRLAGSRRRGPGGQFQSADLTGHQRQQPTRPEYRPLDGLRPSPGHPRRAIAGLYLQRLVRPGDRFRYLGLYSGL